MTDLEFDTALVTAAFRLAGEEGWPNVNVARAARAAGLPLSEARARFPSRSTILLRFGRLADQAALLNTPDEGPVRDRLFDLLMRRFDMLQIHRSGVKALMRALPADPSMAMLLACATTRSMRWMLQAAGITANGPRGEVQVRGLLAVWLWSLRAWDRDESEDLSGTMAAVDTALQRADRLTSWLHRTQPAPAVPPPPPVSAGAGELDPANPPSARPPPDSPPPVGPPPNSPPAAGAPPIPNPPPITNPPPDSPRPAGAPPIANLPPTGNPPFPEPDLKP
jgi:ubiquinone biosynthesis protein COQ9